MEFLFVAALIVGLGAAVFMLSQRPGRARFRELDEVLRKPARPLAPPHSIFVSYRRKDSGDTVGRLYDHLIEAYGADAVFKDVDAISLGRDFRDALDQALAQCQVFVCVIGPNWGGVAGSAGGTARAIDDPGDFVRMEVETALARDVLVLPVLVQNAAMPAAGSLPASLRMLSYRQSQHLRVDPDFRNDVNRLCTRIDVQLQGTFAKEQVHLDHEKQ